MSLRPPGKRQQKNETKQNTLLGRRAVSANRPQGPRPAAASAEVPCTLSSPRNTRTPMLMHTGWTSQPAGIEPAGPDGERLPQGMLPRPMFKADHVQS